MASRCSFTVLAFIICVLTAFVFADIQEKISVSGDDSVVIDDAQTEHEGNTPTTVESEDQIQEEAAGGQQWEATVMGTTQSDPPSVDEDVPDTEESPPPPPPDKDTFQEELVIRPLHSGDIYASFQFATLWDTDFVQGSRGMYAHLTQLYRRRHFIKKIQVKQNIVFASLEIS